MSELSTSRRRAVPRSAGRRSRIPAVGVGLLLLLGSCADFSEPQGSFGAQPSLTPPAANPVEPTPPRVGQSSSSSLPPSTPSASPSSGAPSSGGTVTDPCRPTDPAVIAACLDAPWGLVVMKDGQSALVGERTSGRILQIAPQKEPVEYTTIDGIDAAGSGGLLGIALSPAFDEDGLIYAYVTTASDNRVIRFAKGDRPKAILTGIPRGTDHNGGRIAFGTDGQLYVGTGDTGNPQLAGDPKSLAGKVLRVDEFGKPAKGNPTEGSAVFAAGFTDVTGMCLLGSGIGALDHRPTIDVLIGVKAGGKYTSPGSAAVWTWKKADGGAVDCELGSSQLGFSSAQGQRVVGIRVNQQGGFTGTPQTLLDNRYGRLLTLTIGLGGTDQEVFWASTSNKDGHGAPGPSDDRVVVIPAAGGGGGGGGPD